MKALGNFTHGNKAFKYGDEFKTSNTIEEKQLKEAGLIGEIKATQKKKGNAKSKSHKKL